VHKVVREIVQDVAERHDVTVDGILSYDTHRRLACARHEAWALIRRKDPDFYSYPLIASQVNRLSHGTIIIGIRAHIRREGRLHKLDGNQGLQGQRTIKKAG